jgi:hypothetical protein
MIPTPKLPNAFTVLALAHREGRGTIILVWLRTNPVTPFATYRMDEHGNCHGGDYCQTCDEAESSYVARVGANKLVVLPPTHRQAVGYFTERAEEERKNGDAAYAEQMEQAATRHASADDVARSAVGGRGSSRPGDMAAVYAEENGVPYEQALVACNMD